MRCSADDGSGIVTTMKQKIEKLRKTLFKNIVALCGKSEEDVMLQILSQKQRCLPCTIETIDARDKQIKFYCLNDMTVGRARTLFIKEPETIEWIDTFEEGDVLWDIGANVGVYSLYAAIIKKADVLSFEPSASNYFILNKNIEINDLSEKVRAFCIAFSDSRSSEQS